MYSRIYNTPDGESHFEDVTDANAPSFPAGEVKFGRMAAGMFADFHCAVRRQFVITLAGGAEITASNGDVRRMDPGSVMLADDLEGKGHQTRVLDGTDR